MKIFDPLGWLAPLTTKAKIIMQYTWTVTDLTWDTELPDRILNAWLTFRDRLETCKVVQIQRWLKTESNVRSFQLYGFADASERAFAAVVFLRIEQVDGSKCCKNTFDTDKNNTTRSTLILCSTFVNKTIIKNK